MSDINAILNERAETHGDFKNVAMIAQHIRDAYRGSDEWYSMSNSHKEALDAIAGKMARIICGKASFADHWDDIAGYAMLGKQS